MDEARGVGLGEALEDANADANHTQRIERRVALEHARELIAVEALHREVEQAVVGLAKIKGSNGIGMRELAADARFVEEALDLDWIGRDFWPHHLQHNLLSGQRVLGRKHGTKAALADHLGDFVAAADGSAEERLVRIGR